MTFSIDLGLLSSSLKYIQAKELLQCNFSLHALFLCCVRLKKGKEKEVTISDTQSSQETVISCSEEGSKIQYGVLDAV